MKRKQPHLTFAAQEAEPIFVADDFSRLIAFVTLSGIFVPASDAG